MRLPRSDEFGNYWLGQRTTGEFSQAGPAIFPSKSLHDGKVINEGCFLAFTGSDDGFLFNGPKLSKFPTAQAALAALVEAGAILRTG